MSTNALDLTNDDIAAMQAADDPDPDPAPELDPVPEPEPQAVGERELKALNREIEKYANGLRRVMGDDFAGLHECPHCSGQVPGFLFQEPNPLDQYRVDPDKVRCEACDGYGMLQSGSRTDNALVMCMSCTGNGYVTRPVPQQAWGAPPPNQVPGQVPPGYLPPSSETMPTQDQWGRTLGHPQFGMHPDSIGR